ncbi:hypothetical protein BGZ61DRAFT_118194 [Ilyonectria robusta]|uniref:uncharacterized protein n=1 Tax=Ilyonectria robusta TaxID=1079257 RepID=UPI001E8DD8F4|nr:uncharacterized protein BGZ61DRAFT_118194 [Ilyonectria robusta]KAH8667779.1 hypothetical protein BGZ61DRAFT_118194 [Ilyonectria robusta]
MTFSRAQTWSAVPAIVDFRDETELTGREYHVETEHRNLSLSPDVLGRTDSVSPPSAPLGLTPFTPPDPKQDLYAVFVTPSPFMTLERFWPLNDSIEPLLLQHFTNEVAWFFDFCDRERHFAVEVPHRARSCPPLLDAIFAISSRHLSRIRKHVDPYLADRYYQRCLESLIPELGCVGSHCVDDLLAATVVLRLLEEFDVPISGLDKYQHSVGTRALLRSQTAQVPSATGLRRAASWAGLRQEIYGSLNAQQPPAIKASVELLSHLDSSQDDCAWANRAVSHCLEVLEFCFGESCKSTESFDALLASNVQWDTDRAPSYDPLCFQTRPEQVEPDNNPFWDIRLHSSWHVMGWQYRNLARLLLITHDPHIPRIGLRRQAAVERMNDEARSMIKMICSIALSNPSTPTAMVVACMAVQVGGDLLEDPRERRAVLDLLVELEVTHGWPTKDVLSALMGIWPEAEIMVDHREE